MSTDFHRLADLALLAALRVSVNRVEAAGGDAGQLQNDKLTNAAEAPNVEASASEIAEFLALPPHVRQQALRYARRWRDGVAR